MTNSRLYNTVWIGMLCLLFPSLLLAQTKMSLEANKQQIEIGDIVIVTLKLNQTQKADIVSWPAITDNLFKVTDNKHQLEIVQIYPIDTLVSNGAVNYVQKIEISAYDSGVYIFPKIQIDVLNAQKQTYTFESEAFPIEVSTVAVDTTKAILPIKNIILVEVTWVDYWYYFVMGFVLLVIVVILMIYYIKKKKIQPFPVPIVQLKKSLREEMKEQFSHLQSKLYIEKGEKKAFYTDLSELIRYYINCRFHIPALEMTSDQVLEIMKQKVLSLEEQIVLKNLLQIADLVKFAKAESSIEDMKSALERAQYFVNITLPKETIDEGSNAKI